MAALLAAEVVAAGAHGLDHVAVAHLGAHHLPAEGGHGLLQPHVAHHRGHQGLFLELAAVHEFARADGHDVVAVNDPAVLVADDQPVAVAVQGEPDVRAQLLHPGGHHLRVQRPAARVDIGAVRLAADAGHPRTQFGKHVRRDLVGGAVGAVEDNVEVVEHVVLGKGVLQGDDVAAGRVLDARGPAHLLGHGPERRHLLREDEVLDVRLHLVGQLEAVGREDLDAVVLEGVVRGGDDHAGVGAHGGGDEGDARGGQRPDQLDVDAHGADARGQRVLEHVAGQAGVLADDDGVAAHAVLDDEGDGPAELHGDLGGHGVDVGDAADTVGAEELFHNF